MEEEILSEYKKRLHISINGSNSNTKHYYNNSSLSPTPTQYRIHTSMRNRSNSPLIHRINSQSLSPPSELRY